MVQVNQIVVIGASGGGIEVLRTLAAALPAMFPAPICIVLHTAPQSPGILDEILSRAGPLPATNAINGERLQPGHIYVAPPDCHLLVEPGRLRVTKGPKENRFRPAIDPLFRSAAQVYGPGTIGVLLTGSLDDGTAGLWTVKQLGGAAIVQDPADALFPGMPQHAIDHVKIDHVVPSAEIPPLLVRLTAVPVEARPVEPAPEHVAVEVKIAMEHNPIDVGLEQIGEPSRFACPECHGVLLQIKDGPQARFRCHTGHAYSGASLLAAINEQIEESLWTSIRALEEGQLLLCRMADHMNRNHAGAGAAALTARADEVKQQSDVIRRLVTSREPFPFEHK
jgi:two-component system, chemotaxis family, protein-glutamate methylesterase/glutaminase